MVAVAPPAGVDRQMRPLYELCALIGRHAANNGAGTVFPGVSLTRWESPSTPAHVVYRPVLCIIAQGAKRTILADQVFDYAAGQFLVVSVDLPIIGHVVDASPEKPYLAVSLTLKPEAMAALLMETPVPESVAATARGLAVSQATPDLIDPVVRLLRLLDHPKDAAVLGPMIEREILWRLLTSDQGMVVRQIGVADSRLSQISRAIRLIGDHYALPLRVEELADVAAMSASSFHRHFKAVTAMSPLQYQKQVRLQAARARLLIDQQDVAGVGFSVGYDSPSQFSREYSRMFGAPPRRDAARWRIASTAERRVA